MSVVSTLITQPPMVADVLRRQADQFIDLSDLQHEICRTQRPESEREYQAHTHEQRLHERKSASVAIPKSEEVDQ